MTRPDPAQFPQAPDGWSIDKAADTAGEMGLALTADHWSVIAGLQDYFARHDVVNRRELVDALNEKFYLQGGTRYLYLLFPGGPVAQGSVIAGLRTPSGSIDKSFGSVV